MADVTTQPRATSTRKPSPSKATATPPEPTGVQLAAIPRGRNEELRVTLDNYSGHDYVGLRVWAQDQAGGWWPVRSKGCSIRLGELPEVLVALQVAADMFELDPFEG